MTDMKGSLSADADVCALHKEWDETLCPICMDHPHNAVLLLCGSHDKGCRSYICDTSYRHSNCLDRFKKLRVDHKSSPIHPTPSFVEMPDSGRVAHSSVHSTTSESIFENPRTNRNSAETQGGHTSEENRDGILPGLLSPLEEGNSNEPIRFVEAQTTEAGPDSHVERISYEELGGDAFPEPNLHLKCPLCRGNVKRWMVVKEARDYLDLKPRSCSRESCSFIGNYHELRRHARRVHPRSRPTDIDPSRQRAWRHLEHQREYGDIVSAIRSAMPGAIVLGDYVIDNGDGLSHDGGNRPSEGSGPWWTTFFLFHMISPMARIDEPRDFSRGAWRRHRRSSGAFSSRRNLWGENLLCLHDAEDDDDDWNLGSDVGDEFPIPRRRRRFTQSRPDDDHP